MVLTPSTMVPLGTPAPNFELPDTKGNTVALADFAGKPLLVAFICNHCPYVKHIADKLAERTTHWANDHGIGVVLINSNDVENYPDDSPEKMVDEVALRGYTAPYLFDEDQSVARAYNAACTPDFFLYDADHKLAFRGQFDSSRPGNGEPVTGATLTAAVHAVIGRGDMPSEAPSIGCNIKWKEE